MPRFGSGRRHGALDPLDRSSEVLFGIIMTLTFTQTVSVATGGEAGVRAMLLAAFGSNLAWGLVDGVMYAVTSVLDRNRATAILAAIHSGDAARANALLRAALPESLVPLVDDGDLDRLREHLADAPPPPGARLQPGDVRTALLVTTLVFVSTLPLVLPFLLVDDVRVALRLSNAVALVMLFGVGVEFGRHAGLRPVRTGLAMLALGGALVTLTVLLGG
ncbi:MAG TPA: hypothetical protein VFX50_18880 [Gemmatimonadales bacterium]|nr:hypothetical protein [Gemmatimonadales bacterium]